MALRFDDIGESSEEGSLTNCLAEPNEEFSENSILDTLPNSAFEYQTCPAHIKSKDRETAIIFMLRAAKLFQLSSTCLEKAATLYDIYMPRVLPDQLEFLPAASVIAHF